MTTVRAYNAASPPTDGDVDTNATNVGLEFYTATTAWVTHLHWWQATTTTSTSTRSLAVYQVNSASSGTLMQTASSSAPVGSGWQTVALGTPIAISASTRYRMVCWHPAGRYVATGGYFVTGGAGATDQTFGSLLTIPNNTNSTGNDQGAYFYAGAIAFPTDSFNGANYWVDVTVTDVNPSGAAVPPLLVMQTRRAY